MGPQPEPNAVNSVPFSQHPAKNGLLGLLQPRLLVAVMGSVGLFSSPSVNSNLA